MTRQRLPACALLRMRADADGRLVLASSGGGRGAWVVPTAEAIVRLEKGPGQAGRSVRRSGLHADGLLDAARTDADLDWQRALERCRRAGVLRSGREQLRTAPHAGALLVILARGASAHAIPPWAAALPCFPLDVDATALGRRIDRGARSVIVVTPSSPSQGLLASLRRRAALGYTPRPSKDGTVGETSRSIAVDLSRGLPPRADQPHAARASRAPHPRQPTAAAGPSSEGPASTP